MTFRNLHRIVEWFEERSQYQAYAVSIISRTVKMPHRPKTMDKFM